MVAFPLSVPETENASLLFQKADEAECHDPNLDSVLLSPRCPDEHVIGLPSPNAST